jgi:hypothetical protein
MYTRCSRVLEREIELLRSVGDTQKQVWDAVLKREWAGFEALLAMTGPIGAELERLEGERKALFNGFPASAGGQTNQTGQSAQPGQAAADDETGFYRLISPLPPEERGDLAAKYRELKMAALRIRTNNENLLAYIAGIRATMSAFVESAFPDRKGRLYTRRGAAAPQDMRCMVLNHRL